MNRMKRLLAALLLAAMVLTLLAGCKFDEEDKEIINQIVGSVHDDNDDDDNVIDDDDDDTNDAGNAGNPVVGLDELNSRLATFNKCFPEIQKEKCEQTYTKAAVTAASDPTLPSQVSQTLLEYLDTFETRPEVDYAQWVSDLNNAINSGKPSSESIFVSPIHANNLAIYEELDPDTWPDRHSSSSFASLFSTAYPDATYDFDGTINISVYVDVISSKTITGTSFLVYYITFSSSNSGSAGSGG